MVLFNTPFFRTDRIWTHFYPSLTSIEDYKYDSDKTNLLVLAGSVLTPDSVTVNIGGQQISANFCDLQIHLDSDRYNVLNLARTGHNSRDSYYKFKYLEGKEEFDHIFLYHGINDVRANNISKDRFDERYRHIEFYDDLAVVESHGELKVWATPFLFNWLIHSITKKNKHYIPKELFHGLLAGDPEDDVKEGKDIKTNSSFSSHLEYIIQQSEANRVLLGDYAWYLPDNYTHEAFKRQELDYAQQIFPTELYGMPENVVKGLKAHAEVIDALQKEYDVISVDLEGVLEKSAIFFDDICHITIVGCEVLKTEIERALSPE